MNYYNCDDNQTTKHITLDAGLSAMRRYNSVDLRTRDRRPGEQGTRARMGIHCTYTYIVHT